jgi:hypothetical protein
MACEDETHDRSEDGSCNELTDRPRPRGSTLPDCAMVPHLVLADRLDQYVDQLLPISREPSSTGTRERYVDLMMGLSGTATAMRASVDGDPADAASALRSAIEQLRRVDPAGLTLPPAPQHW